MDQVSQVTVDQMVKDYKKDELKNEASRMGLDPSGTKHTLARKILQDMADRTVSKGEDVEVKLLYGPSGFSQQDSEEKKEVEDPAILHALPRVELFPTDRGPLVTELKRAIDRCTQYYVTTDNDVFDEATLQAVNNVRRELALPMTNMVDEEVWDYLEALLNDA